MSSTLRERIQLTGICTCCSTQEQVHRTAVGQPWRHDTTGSPASTFHLHRDYDSRDCDSRYTGYSILTCAQFEDVEHEDDVWDQAVRSEITTHGIQKVEIEVDPYDRTRRKASFDEQTDEGYRSVNLRGCYVPWCEHVDHQPQHRDHTAESMGY